MKPRHQAFCRNDREKSKAKWQPPSSSLGFCIDLLLSVMVYISIDHSVGGAEI